MKKILLALFLAFTLMPLAFAGSIFVEEEDGSPSVPLWKLKVGNGSLTDNGDATATLNTGSGSGDSVTINSTSVDTTAEFTDNIYTDFTLTDGGAGGPDVVTVKPNYGLTLAGNHAFGVDECSIGADTSGGFLLCEGSTADTSEFLMRLPNVNPADATYYFLGTSASIAPTAISAFLDEDNMATDSATALASQQSIKAYADTKLSAVGPTDMTATDFGDWTCNGTVCSLDADTVGTSEIATNAVGEAELDGSMNETISGSWNFGSGILEVPNNTATTSTDCDAAGEAGRIFVDTDATSGQQLYVCEGTSGWVLQGDGGGGGGGDSVTINSTAVDTTADFADNIYIDYTITDGGAGGPDTVNSVFNYNAVTGDHALSANQLAFGANGFVVEGATADTIETYVQFGDPTASDKTITFFNATDTVVGKATTDTLTNKTIDGDNNSISNLAVGAEVDATFSAEATAAIGGIEFQETDTLTDCSTFAATGGGIFYDDSEGKFKKCQDNTLTDLDTGGAETNALESDGASGIADTEVFIGTGAGTGNYAALSGDVTMANTGATTIGNDKILEAMLKAVDTASDEECLTYETTTGDFEWQSCGGGGGTAFNEVPLPIQSAKISGSFVTDGDATNGAQIDAGEGGWRLLFDEDSGDTVDEAAVWQFKMPNNYSSAPVLEIIYTMVSANSGTVEFEGAIMCVSDGDSADVATASFSTIAVGSATVPGTVGYPDKINITLTDDASPGACAADDAVWIYLSTDANDATNDSATGDREVIDVTMSYTAS